MKKDEKEQRQHIKEEIIKCLNEMGVKIKSIILFGSRARGQYTKYSDWDFLIIVKGNISLKEKRKIAKAIRERLADFYIPCDVIVKSENEIEYYKDFIGTVSREALKEGIPL